MNAARYNFIGDDLDYAAVGMLTIVNLRDLRYYGRESRWLPIPESKEAGGQRTDD